MNSKHKGFTLIELMITLTILAIIASIAYPSYQDQVNKTRRSEGKVFLMGIAQRMERCFTQYNAYNHGNCPTFPQTSESGYYQATVARTATTYTLTATARGAQAGDTYCATLTINQANNKGGTNSGCW